MNLRLSKGFAAAIVGASLASSGCSNDCPNCPGDPAVLRVSPGAASVLPSKQVSFKALLLDSHNNLLTGHAATWATSDQGIATVDDTGLVSGVAVGPVFIIATAEGLVDSSALSVTSTPTFAANVYPILAATCATATCHLSPGPPPNLSSSATAYTTLTTSYVTAGDTTIGTLLTRLRSVAAPMPPGKRLVDLQPGNYDLIALWIAQGAVN